MNRFRISRFADNSFCLSITNYHREDKIEYYVKISGDDSINSKNWKILFMNNIDNFGRFREIYSGKYQGRSESKLDESGSYSKNKFYNLFVSAARHINRMLVHPKFPIFGNIVI